MSTSPRFHTAAQLLAARGLAVVPLHGTNGALCGCNTLNCPSPGKHPVTRDGVKAASNDPAVISAWTQEFPNANIGVATGSVSGVVVLDIDPRHGGDESLRQLIITHGALPATRQVSTGGGGQHYYFKSPSTPLTNRAGIRPGIDLRADGGYVVAPPSTHASGGVYTWVEGRAPDQIELAELPPWLLELLRPASSPTPTTEAPTPAATGAELERLLSAAMRYAASVPPAQEGARNDRAFQLSGHLHSFKIRETGAELTHEQIRAVVSRWNDNNKPPLSADEIAKVVASAMANGTPRATKWIDAAAGEDSVAGGRRKVVELLVEDALELSFVVDSGPERDVYAQVEKDGHIQTWPLHGWELREHLLSGVWARYKIAANVSNLRDALTIVECHARANGDRREVFLRIGGEPGAVWLDLGDSDWRAVKVTARGYSLETFPSVVFKRSQGMMPLPAPCPGQGLTGLRKLWPQLDNRSWILIVAWLIGALRPIGPYVLPILTGLQGSGKSTFFRMLRRLLDPHSLLLRSFPNSEANLAIAASQNWVLAFDNLSVVTPHMSDALCRLATGGGFATRTLYTNREESAFNATRPVILNGINNVATASDLLDRAIVIELPTISEGARKTEAEFWAAFEPLWASVLHDLLTAVSHALATLGSVKLDRLPRMADFAKWAAAAMPALGISAEEFLAAFEDNRSGADETVVESSAVATSIRRFAELQQAWTGEASDLLKILNNPVITPLEDQQGREWPKSPATLGSQLRRVAPNLARLGVTIEHSKSRDSRKRRLITISRTGAHAQAPPTAAD